MRIDDVFDRCVFSNCAMKFLLNLDTIRGIVDTFSNKSFDEWEDRDCEYCTPERKCKKHSALDRISLTDRIVEVEGIHDYSGVSNLYMSKSDMFLVNRKYNSVLIIDCPPFFSNEYPISDIWVRKINPFSIVSRNSIDIYEKAEVVQTLDIDEVVKHRKFSCYFGKLEDQNKFIVVQKVYDSYLWRIEDK